MLREMFLHLILRLLISESQYLIKGLSPSSQVSGILDFQPFLFILASSFNVIIALITFSKSIILIPSAFGFLEKFHWPE